MWLLLAFAFLALGTLFYLRRSNMNSLLAKPVPPGTTEEAGPAATNR